MSHCINWGVGTEQGYSYDKTFTNRQPLHEHMEDVYTVCNVEKTKIFILADGHGGVEAPKFFVSRMSEVMQDLFSLKWDLNEPSQRLMLRQELSCIFKKIDQEYVELKTMQFKNNQKTHDDGCTLIVNILHENWHINCNVGDSRTVLAECDDEWKLKFASADHNMEHKGKINHILTHGGKFVDPLTCTIMAADHRTNLSNARIFRPMSPAVRAVGCSNRRTLNLTSTMGDLIFKIEPAVMSSEPDITINELDADKEYCLVMATDGVWDHLKPCHNSKTIVDYIGSELSSDSETQVDDVPALSSSSHEEEEELDKLAKVLVKRESIKNSLFTPLLSRYDDATCLLVYLSKK